MERERKLQKQLKIEENLKKMDLRRRKITSVDSGSSQHIEARETPNASVPTLVQIEEEPRKTNLS